MDEQVEVLAQEAYAAYCAKLEGKAPAGLAGPPYDLQSWAELPAIVRAAWVAALEALLPSNPEVQIEAEPDLVIGESRNEWGAVYMGHAADGSAVWDPPHPPPADD